MESTIVSNNIFKGNNIFEHHTHQCPDCGFIWDHNPDNCPSEETYAASHDCQRCGTNTRHLYSGDEESMCHHDGVSTHFYRPGEHPIPTEAKDPRAKAVSFLDSVVEGKRQLFECPVELRPFVLGLIINVIEYRIDKALESLEG